MAIQPFSCVILAAGKGTRMVSKIPKIAHNVMGKPMVRHVVAAAQALNPEEIIVITGHERAVVENCLKDDDVTFRIQAEQKGTAHAVLSAGDSLNRGHVLVLYGDVPLVKASSLRSFMDAFSTSDGIIFMTTDLEKPDGYGRIMLGPDNEIIDIIEDNDASDEVKKIRTINTGICMIRQDLVPLIRAIAPNNKKGEYYLTDICKMAREKGVKVKSFLYPQANEVLGVNTRRELLEANLIMRNEILDRHMESGVTIADRTVYIESDVIVGRDTIVFPNSSILGKTIIGEDAIIGPNVVIRDSTIGRGVTVRPFSCLSGIECADEETLGPYYGMSA
jgi:bifunctional UDP-N-acetylglucosamine pyrophosphorylase / glucosamine-1-phosphate N-acetyltransferase